VVSSHLAQHKCPEKVIFVCFDAATRQAYRDALGRKD
jgi:O-acetyl-ADP-ribose deacetylase (regulator of RNase III)